MNDVHVPMLNESASEGTCLPERLKLLFLIRGGAARMNSNFLYYIFISKFSVRPFKHFYLIKSIYTDAQIIARIFSRVSSFPILFSRHHFFPAS